MQADGGSRFFERLFKRALPNPVPSAAQAPSPVVTHSVSTPPPGQGPVLRQVLARQVLEMHLRRRHEAMEEEGAQLGAAEPAEASLLLRAMLAAGHADGALDGLEAARIRRALARSPLSEADRQGFEERMSEPPSLEALLREIDSPQLASRVYAASVRTIRRGEATNRTYLDYLAQRLRLPGDMVVRLNRRWDVPV